MPNTVMVKPHAELLTIRSIRKNGRGYAMGTVMLKSVTVQRDGIVGDWLAEFTEVRELGAEALKHMRAITLTDKGFVYADELETFWVDALEAVKNGKDGPESPQSLTGQTFRTAYVCGPEFYVSKWKDIMYKGNLSVRRARLAKAYDIADSAMSGAARDGDEQTYLIAMNRREAIWRAFLRLGIALTDDWEVLSASLTDFGRVGDHLLTLQLLSP